jgi:hypothetical protein
MSRKPTVIIVINGGVLQSVLTDGDVDAFDVITIDYDVQNSDPDAEVAMIPQDEGYTEPAFANRFEVEQCTPSWVDDVRHAIDNPEQLGDVE